MVEVKNKIISSLLASNKLSKEEEKEVLMNTALREAMDDFLAMEESRLKKQENNILNQYKNLISNSNNSIDAVLNLATKLKSQLDVIGGAQETLDSQCKSLFVVSHAINFPKRK